ncbi:hypothetical protein L7F22_040372 [Adiantum nelumboides]|nr:hypothetical protein [Adiantum nelumboides]
MAIKQQEDKLQTMQDKLESLTNTTQDRLITQDEKLTHICEQATSDVGTWANIVKNANGNAMEHIAQEHHVKADVDVNERNEREKRAMNVMIRGLSEKDNETVFTLNASISDFFTEHFGMQDVVVYGAHRVGKKREGDRAVVCTMLDARKRAIVLENARFYLQNSKYHIKEDFTPAQQEIRRRAYEERKKETVGTTT